MTLCPVAIAVGCKKCPVFKVCPAKSTLGDFRPADESSERKPGADKDSAKRK
jgi:hypothetical protein